MWDIDANSYGPILSIFMFILKPNQHHEFLKNEFIKIGMIDNLLNLFSLLLKRSVFGDMPEFEFIFLFVFKHTNVSLNSDLRLILIRNWFPYYPQFHMRNQEYTYIRASN